MPLILQSGLSWIFRLCSWGVMGRLLVAAVVAFAVISTAGVGEGEAFAVTSLHELRWENVHRQQTDVSCGPASLVTLLGQYYGLSVDEETIYAMAAGAIDELPEEPIVAWRSTSLADLSRVLDAYGFQSVGLQMDGAQLLRFFHEVGLPIIAHVRIPQNHFVVIVGIAADDGLLIADSSRGQYVESIDAFVRRSSGYFLAYVPPRPVDAERIAAHRHAAAERQVLLRSISVGAVPR